MGYPFEVVAKPQSRGDGIERSPCHEKSSTIGTSKTRDFFVALPRSAGGGEHSDGIDEESSTAPFAGSLGAE